MRLLFILVMALSLSGCITQQRCSRKYPPAETLRDSINIQKEVIYRDTVIYRTLPPDTVMVWREMPASVPDTEPLTAENQHAFAKAWIGDGRMWLRLFMKPQPIAFTLQNKTQLENRYQGHSQTKIERVPYVPAIYQWCLWIVIAQIVALVGRLALKYLRLRGGKN